jgi:HemY protein
MKGVFWFLGLAAVAVALALLMGQNHATVSLFWFPHRIDVSFNLALFVLMGLFVLVHLALRGAGLLTSLPQKAQRWRQHQQERAVNSALMDALTFQLAGRFVRAQTAAQHAIELLVHLPRAQFSHWDQAQVLAHLLAAESAQALGNRERRDAMLEIALQSEAALEVPEAREGALLRATRWAIEERNTDQARRFLAELPQGAGRRIQALRLKLKLARLQNDPAGALELVRLLAKHRAFSPAVAASLQHALALDNLRSTHDLAQLAQFWRTLDGQERQSPELAVAVLERLAHLDAETPLADDCVQLLWANYSQLAEGTRKRFIRHLAQALSHSGSEWLASIEKMQQQHPADLDLQYLAGQAFLQHRLWGKATHCLQQVAGRLSETEWNRSAWCGLAQMAQERGDMDAAQKAWKAAALVSGR